MGGHQNVTCVSWEASFVPVETLRQRCEGISFTSIKIAQTLYFPLGILPHSSLYSNKFLNNLSHMKHTALILRFLCDTDPLGLRSAAGPGSTTTTPDLVIFRISAREFCVRYKKSTMECAAPLCTLETKSLVPLLHRSHHPCHHGQVKTNGRQNEHSIAMGDFGSARTSVKCRLNTHRESYWTTRSVYSIQKVLIDMFRVSNSVCFKCRRRAVLVWWHLLSKRHRKSWFIC